MIELKFIMNFFRYCLILNLFLEIIQARVSLLGSELHNRVMAWLPFQKLEKDLCNRDTIEKQSLEEKEENITKLNK